jgi:predicted Zn-dependent peptidase
MQWENWYKKIALQNGLKLWYRHFDSITSAIYAIVDAGGEKDGSYPGIAHFTEHMLFRGTKNMPNDHIKYFAAERGIQIGAATGKEMFIFKAENVIDVQAALDIVFEAIALPVFPQEGFLKEKPVIMSEIKRSEDDNARRALGIAMAHMVKYPFNLPNLGFVESVEQITPDIMRQFHEHAFTPHNTTLCYVGSMPEDDVVALFSRVFDNWKTSKNKWQGSYPTPELPNQHVIKRDCQQTFVSMNYRGISSDNDDFECLEALCDIIGGSMVSRMFIELRNERGLCYQCGIRMPTFSMENGIISLYGMVPNDNLGVFIHETNNLISYIKNGEKPITDKELASAKARFNANLCNKADNLNSQLALFMTTWKNSRSLYKRIEAINALTAKDVNRAAERYLSDEPFIVTVGAKYEQ